MTTEWNVAQDSQLIGSVKANSKMEARKKASGLPMYSSWAESTTIWKLKNKKYWK